MTPTLQSPASSADLLPDDLPAADLSEPELEVPEPSEGDSEEADAVERPARATVYTTTTREDGQIKIRIVVRHAPRTQAEDLPWDEVDEAPVPPPPARGALDALFGPMLRVFSR